MKILLVLGRVFYPTNSGGRIRSAQTFERLARAHHIDVSGLSFSSEDRAAYGRVAEWAHRVDVVEHTETRKGTRAFYAEVVTSLGSTLPYTARKYINPELRRRVATAASNGRYDLVICDFLQPAVNCSHVRDAPTLLFQHNVEAIIRRRQVASEGNPLMKAALAAEYVKLRRFEGRMLRTFSWTVAVSEDDRELFREWYGVESVGAVPTGVDAEYFRPTRTGEASEPLELVFTGSMDWLPNEDAMLHFIDSVLPALAAKHRVRLCIVGRNPSTRLREVARTSPHDIHVTGTVDDVREHIERAAVYILPLRVGGGTRIKVYEAMAMGKAVVSTTVGVEGLAVRPDEHLLIADDSAAFAAQTSRLLSDREARVALGHRARTHVVDACSWDTAATQFEHQCHRAVEQYAVRRGASR